MSSIKPNDTGSEVDCREEVAGGLVIARGDGAELLEPGEEILDQMARLVEVAIIGPRRAAIELWRDHHRLAGGGQRLDDPPGATHEIGAVDQAAYRNAFSLEDA